MAANRPHFHAWLQVATGRIFYKIRAFHTRQAAHKWGARRQPGPSKRLVLACDLEACRPRLD